MRRLSEVICHQKPWTLPLSASVAEACRLMRKHRIGAVLVTDRDDRLMGIFTTHDAVDRVLADGKRGNDTNLAQVMTPNPITMSPNKTATDALRLMRDGRFSHIPIVEDGKLIGVVSHGDFAPIECDRMEQEHVSMHPR